MDTLLATFRQAIVPWRDRCAWVLALSGGCDSRVLLDLAQRLRAHDKELPPIRAIHIDHGLHTESANWSRQCKVWCDEAHIPLIIRKVQVSGRRQGLEKLAREARYRAFAESLADGELLLMAHHLDDQAETLMLRMLRGAGLAGMAAMPVQRSLGNAALFRPLLAASRGEIMAYAQARGLEWIDDPSNDNHNYDRNFIRHRIMPVLQERWPDYRNRLEKVVALQAQSTSVLQEYLKWDVANLCAEDGGLDLQQLGQYGPARQREVLRYFLRERVGLEPERAQLEELLRQCFSACDRQPVFSLSGKSLRRYRAKLYCITEALVENLEPVIWTAFDEALHLPMGRLVAQPGGRFLPRGEVCIGWRKPGMRVHLAGETRSRALKTFLQERGIPPWRREFLPLIYCDGELAAIADLAVCEGYATAEGQGWTLAWEP